MKISYHWLQEFIDINESPEVLGEVLTQTGLEVESIEKVERVPGGLEGLLVGEVMECTPHPNADKLKLTKVDVGFDELLSIVCGAPNVAKGQKVIVAPVGTTIHPVGGDPFKITKAKIRGELSEGMLCAEDEIGLGSSHEGLLVLDTNEKNGTLAKVLFETGSDHIFEIGLTPNRGDAASHMGAARDLKAYFNRPLKIPSMPARPVKMDRPITVEVQDSTACPRYSGATIRGVKVGPSPEWLQWKLKSVGLSPINNIVDITNYVMMGIGQPMHAFDADKIAGGKVIVKQLKEGTPFQTLDEVDRKLSKDDLMICDEKGGMCIAGVFGGIGTGITNSTTNVFLESAYFNADSVRATAMRHGLSTDASFRFERGMDPEMTIPALHWAVGLIIEIAGGYLASDYLDVYPNEIAWKEIKTTFYNFERLIGKKIPNEQIISILNALDIETNEVSGDDFTVRVPPYRSEVTREADLVEEVLRIYGINNVELDDQHLPGRSGAAIEDAKAPYKVYEELSIFLSGRGFSEIITNSLTNPEYFKKVPVSAVRPVEILNKSSEELGYMKTTPIYTALESVRHNINRRKKNIRFFELCRVYGHEQKGFTEKDLLTFYLTGDASDEHWIQAPKPVSIYDLAGTIYSMLDYIGVADYEIVPLEQDDRFEYGMEVRQNNFSIGEIGKLKKEVVKYFEINQEIFHAAFDWKKLVGRIRTEKTFSEISKFPEVRRDLSLVLGKEISFKAIKDLALDSEKKLLKRLNVFSVYEGESLGSDKKAYAISFYLQDHEQTLTDKAIDKTMQRLIDAYEKQLGAIIRK